MPYKHKSKKRKTATRSSGMPLLNITRTEPLMFIGKNITISSLPPGKITTSRSSMPLIEESEITSTDFEEFLVKVRTALQRTMLNAQKNRLYRIVLAVGNFDDSELLWWGNARFTLVEKSEPDRS